MGIKGAILGDIIGSKWEFCGCKDPYKVELFDDKNFFTDDTILSCATKYSIDNNISFESAYRTFSEKYLHYYGAGWGNNFRKWIMREDHKQSFGNGSAMRVGYIGDYFDSISDVVDMAKESAKTTHDTEDGVNGATAVAFMCYFAKHQKRGGTELQVIKEILMHYCDYVYPDYAGWTLNDYRNNYRWSCSCKKSVHIAVRCIYESNSFEECMRNVLSIYCDADTICAIAGSIAEHIFGLPEYADEKLNYYLDAFLCSVVYS